MWTARVIRLPILAARVVGIMLRGARLFALGEILGARS
jgi:hypothetical protein